MRDQVPELRYAQLDEEYDAEDAESAEGEEGFLTGFSGWEE
jgi:hypothetical protein